MFFSPWQSVSELTLLIWLNEIIRMKSSNHPNDWMKSFE